MEYHPENADPQDQVLLGQFGRRILREDYVRAMGATYEGATAPVPGSGPYYFPQTGHTIAPRFREYWERNGGLAQFGYPITEERFDGLGGTAGCCTTQYFERARFEWHPENAPEDRILLGQFGRRVLADNGLLTGPFGVLYRAHDPVRAALGRPRGAPRSLPGAMQPFERGRMYYAAFGGAQGGTIFVLCGGDGSGTIISQQPSAFFPDTWTEGQEPGGGPVPGQTGLYYPQRGFGKVWRENENVRNCLGYARSADETGFTIVVQSFDGGTMLLSDTPEGRFIYVVKTRRICNSCGTTSTYERFPVPAQ
jgi:hypothetical protein